MIHIIGTGPAGLIAGLFLLEEGYDVVIFEKNKHIISSACGEGCDFSSLNLLPFDSSKYIEREIEGIKFHFRDKYFYINYKAVVLNRQKWMEGMANEFMNRGGKIKFSNKVKKIDDKFIYTNEGKIEYDICIGADGPLSITRNYVGSNCMNFVGCEYEIEGKIETNYLEFYLDKEYSSYYAWVFPKKESMNVGLIGKFSLLDKFLKDKGINGKIIKKQAGIIPYGIKKLVKNNVVLIGDAACMANPFSLGGISPLIYASKILAKNIVNLEKYEKEIKKHEMTSQIFMKGKKAVEKLRNEDMEMIFKYINGKEIKQIKYRDLLHLLLHPILLIKAYNISKALTHSIKWGW